MYKMHLVKLFDRRLSKCNFIAVVMKNQTLSWGKLLCIARTSLFYCKKTACNLFQNIPLNGSRETRVLSLQRWGKRSLHMSHVYTCVYNCYGVVLKELWCCTLPLEFNPVSLAQLHKLHQILITTIVSH